YQFATTLHRSLFLKGVGRFFVGLVSLLLCLIAVSGILLLAQRQGGFLELFSKIRERDFAQSYHVILSRWFILPIIIVAATGVYLSAEKFDLLPSSKLALKPLKTTDSTSIFTDISKIPLFQTIKLGDVRKVDFPFSTDPEEYYRIALSDQEIDVNQHTGKVVASAAYPFVVLSSRISLLTHTGQGSVLWSIVLLLSMLSILFFIYSGFTISLRNRKKNFSIKQMPAKDDCEYILLVGSEMGSTFTFAHQLYEALSTCGKKTFLAPLNAYGTFASAKKIIVLAATYGKGDATTNARNFEQLLPKINQKKVDFAVLGFGSRNYPDYCAFAIKIDRLLHQHAAFERLLKLHKVNEQSAESFQSWVHALGDRLGLPLQIQPQKIKEQKLISFEVVDCSHLNIDETFLLRLKPRRKVRFQSGDLLAIVPEGQTMARQYSIAKIGKEILLSIKKHDLGHCSSYLNALETGARFKASIKPNIHFQFPKQAPAVIMIANGTGIAPFLGMLHQKNVCETVLLWGGRTKRSVEIYLPHINQLVAKNDTATFKS
ncbi:MAG: PepSY domain-containing protein, partial [Leeuwenhoekiella sp.]